MIRQLRTGSRRMLTLCLTAAVAAVIAVSPAGPAAAASDATDGRLGGTFASLIERFGESEGQIEGLGVLFAYPDARHLSVQFGTIDDQYEPEDPALFMTVIADRDETAPVSERDPADWSLETAEGIVADLVPADSERIETEEAKGGSITATGRSDALEEAFGTVSLGEWRATYLLSSEETVATITLTLTSGAEVAPEDGTPPPACAGVVDWAAASADRLDAAQALLEDLATIPDDPAEAGSALRGLAEELDGLAAAQREAPAPREVATANFYIIGALTDFADAVALAAEGIESGDQALIDEAVGELDDADARAVDASDEIEAAVLACDLEVATPGAD